MKFFRWVTDHPNFFLRAFVLGSLGIVALCVSLALVISTARQVQREREWAKISAEQLISAFAFQYRFLNEDIASGTYESVNMGVAKIANQFGRTPYELWISDAHGGCKFSASDQTTTTDCTLPPISAQILEKSRSEEDRKPTLRFDRTMDRYLYFTPIFIGDTLYGHLLVAMSDPFQFYRGSLLRLTLLNYSWVILGVIGLCLGWAMFSLRFLIRPYYKMLWSLRSKEALAIQATQVAHNMRSPLAVLMHIVRDTGGLSPANTSLLSSAVSRIQSLCHELIQQYKGTTTAEQKPFTPVQFAI